MERLKSEALQPVFERLRSILKKNAAHLTISEDSEKHYSLDGTPGPATLAAWGGKLKRETIPVAWVDIGKTYVSYHLMACSSPAFRETLSARLEAHMQGKTCFNFRKNDEELFTELEEVTARGVNQFRALGFIV